MHYIIEEGLIEDGLQAANNALKEYLVSLIFAEKPHFADKIVVDNPDQDITILLKICKFLSCVLNDIDTTEDIQWDLNFEGRYHAVTMIVLRTFKLLNAKSLSVEKNS